MTVAPQQDVAVTGGSGGVAARLDDLRAQADVLHALADELEDALLTLGRAECDATALAAVLSPGTGVALEAATLEFFALAAGADLRLRGLAVALHACADAYAAADQLIAASFDLALTTAANAAGHAVRFGLLQGGTVAVVGGTVLLVGGTVRVWSFARDSGLLDRVEDVTGIDADALAQQGAERLLTGLEEGAERLVRRAGAESALTAALLEHVLPGFAAGLLGLPPGVHALPDDTGLLPRDAQSLTGLLLLVGGQTGMFGDQPLARPGGYHRPVDVTVAERPATAVDPRTGRPVPLRAPGSVTDLWEREWAQSAGRRNGAVRVEQVVGEDGRVRHIVYLPATTSQSTDASAETTDNTTNVETAAGFDSAQHVVVRAAIEEAGIGPDDEVMLVGYSQGGLLAGSLLADDAFRSRVNVTTVLTVGAPITDAPPGGVDMLSVEHAQDLIPDLDGRANRDAAHWTTLTVDLDEAEQRAALARRGLPQQDIDRAFSGPTYAHGGLLYDGTIRGLEQARDPRMADWRKRNRDFFDGRVTRVHEAEGTRR